VLTVPQEEQILNLLFGMIINKNIRNPLTVNPDNYREAKVLRKQNELSWYVLLCVLRYALRPFRLKKMVPLFILLLNFLFQQNGYCQAPLNIPDYITKRFQSYCSSGPREEIFIHTDREEYISGEDLWFKIYLIDRQSFKPSLNSRIVYFEVLNADNKPVLQKKILIDKGFGPGQAVLPDSLSSGIYTIRAYTSWMKNFLPNNCFMKDISVYNSYKTKTFIRSVRAHDYKEKTDTLHATSGLKLKVNNFGQDSLGIIIQTNETYRTENKNLVYLFIQSRGEIKQLSTEKITEDTTRIAILKKSLPSGIIQITIFDSKGPVCDRFIFIPEMKRPALTLNSTDSCKRREQVVLDIGNGYGSEGLPDMTNLSVSVSPIQNSSEISDLSDYLVFGTEFGVLQKSKIKGKKIKELSSEVMDSLLLTLKSNWILWDKIFSTEDQYYKYPAEKEDHYLTGKLLTSYMRPEDQNEIIFMSTPGKEAVLQYALTDKNGNFNFRVGIDDTMKDLILMSENRGKNQKVYVESSFSDQYLPTEVVVDSTGKPIPNVSKQSINYQVRKAYGSSTIGDRQTPVFLQIKTKRFYGKPDFELIMKTFIKLDSLQEVFFELVPHVEFGKINALYEMTVEDAFGNKLPGVPCVLIDGVIIKDLSVIANLDPGLVEKIDVVWDKYRVGGNLFNGIVSIITQAGDLSNITLPADAVRIHYKVLDPVSSFVSPDYSSEEMKKSRIADFRNTLYWNPSVKPDTNGKVTIQFWTADIKSDYIINIQGITADGSFVSFRKRIRVN